MLRKIMILVSILLFSISTLFAHSGRTDKFGGHNNRKTGGYHYHNAGSVHDPNNPYQDHTKCGICPTSKSQKNQDDITLSEEELITALQAGLKCMGYNISTIDRNMGSETKKAVRDFLKNKK
jgi:hypothetical protein